MVRGLVALVPPFFVAVAFNSGSSEVGLDELCRRVGPGGWQAAARALFYSDNGGEMLAWLQAVLWALFWPAVSAERELRRKIQPEEERSEEIGR